MSCQAARVVCGGGDVDGDGAYSGAAPTPTGLRRLFTLFVVLAAACLAGIPKPVAHAQPPARPVDQRALFTVVGAMYGIDPELLAAIAQVESGGRADARSWKGAEGLMQLMPQTARRFHVSDPYDPVESVLGAARFIAFLRASLAPTFFTVHLPELIAAYNAGEGAVRRYHGVPRFPETEEYVRKVLWLYVTGESAPYALAPVGQQPAPRSLGRAGMPAGDARTLERLSGIRRARAEAADRESRAASAAR